MPTAYGFAADRSIWILRSLPLPTIPLVPHQPQLGNPRALDLGKREEKRRAILVLSDGGENSSRASSDKALDNALQAGATIYAINMGEQGSVRDLAASGILRNFASKTGGRYVDSPGGQALRDAFAEIAQELGHQYTIAYRPTNHTHDGKWHNIDVKLSRTDVTVRTRKGYKAPKV